MMFSMERLAWKDVFVSETSVREGTEPLKTKVTFPLSKLGQPIGREGPAGYPFPRRGDERTEPSATGSEEDSKRVRPMTKRTMNP
jgi:hypothetical protein